MARGVIASRGRVRTGGAQGGHPFARGIYQALAADKVDLSAHLDLSLAANPHAIAGCGINRGGHHGPALGRILGGVGPWYKAHLQRVAGVDRVFKCHQHLLMPAVDDPAHAHALVARALPTHKVRPGPPRQIAVGEPAVKGARQASDGLLGRAGSVAPGTALTGVHACHRGIQRLAIARDHVVDVIRILHAPLDLEGPDARADQLVQMPGRQVVAWAQQQVAVARIHAPAHTVYQLVGHAAGLGAIAAIGRAAPPARGKRTRPRVANADGAVAKRLDLDARRRHGPNLAHRKLATARHARRPKLLCGQHGASGGMHARLGRQMDLDVRHLPAQAAAQS